MARRLRFIPEGGALVEVTCRTLHGRFLLRPGAELNEIILGILGRAQRRFGVRIHGYCFASNHYHLLLGVDDAHQLANFMHLVQSKLAREAGRLAGWRERIWSRRYEAIVVSEEEAAQVERLRYVLSHGSKEGLVGSPRDWPGVHAVRPLLEGASPQGYWFDRTKEYAARRRGEAFDRLQFATPETVTLEPLPCWAGLAEVSWRERIATLVAGIEEETAAERSRTGARKPPGPAAVLAQHPHDRPLRMKKSSAPLFHATSRAVRRELYEAYGWFVAAFREAAEKVRAGDLTAQFPPGSFPPALPFVPG